MPTPAQTVAAIVIFHGMNVAPMIAPMPAESILSVPRLVPAFTQLAAYMARYKELGEPITFQPYETFSDAKGSLGVAMMPWLRGGARYLQHLLALQNIELPALETVPVTAWFTGLREQAYFFALHLPDVECHACLNNVRCCWDAAFALMSKDTCADLADYYAQTQHTIDLLGLEMDPQRINRMRRKNLLHSVTD